MTGKLRADPAKTTANTPLTLLDQQAQELRTRLAALRRSLANVQRDFSTSQLKEANEKLMLAVAQADTIAASAVHQLDQLVQTSQRDVVTGIPNRALILDRLDNAIALARRHGTHIAVAFLDLDHFKPINDSLGHASGDQVLQLVARRLQAVVRDSDIVSRYGGDEFLVLLTEVSQPADAALIAEKMLFALTAPSVVGRHRLQVSASLGLAIYPQDGDDAQTLIEQADAAMYRVKRGGGANFDFHRAARSTPPCGVDALKLPRRGSKFLPVSPA
ncbi:MAG TPA: GGDEF domain-containing protein [Rhodanobacter sp.]|jgi:diguanylate cyclase (GGDEF) domain